MKRQLVYQRREVAQSPRSRRCEIFSESPRKVPCLRSETRELECRPGRGFATTLFIAEDSLLEVNTDSGLEGLFARGFDGSIFRIDLQTKVLLRVNCTFCYFQTTRSPATLLLFPGGRREC